MDGQKARHSPPGVSAQRPANRLCELPQRLDLSVPRLADGRVPEPQPGHRWEHGRTCSGSAAARPGSFLLTECTSFCVVWIL